MIKVATTRVDGDLTRFCRVCMWCGIAFKICNVFVWDAIWCNIYSRPVCRGTTWWLESYDCHLIMACVLELFISLRQRNRWRQGDYQQCEGGPRRTCQKPWWWSRRQGQSWWTRWLLPRRCEDNEDFTKKRAILYHIILWTACDVYPFDAPLFDAR